MIIRERPMFRFTFRDALWLMVVVALATGCWLDHQYQRKVLLDTWSLVNQHAPREAEPRY